MITGILTFDVGIVAVLAMIALGQLAPFSPFKHTATFRGGGPLRAACGTGQSSASARIRGYQTSEGRKTTINIWSQKRQPGSSVVTVLPEGTPV